MSETIKKISVPMRVNTSCLTSTGSTPKLGKKKWFGHGEFNSSEMKSAETHILVKQILLKQSFRLVKKVIFRSAKPLIGV